MKCNVFFFSLCWYARVWIFRFALFMQFWFLSTKQKPETETKTMRICVKRTKCCHFVLFAMLFAITLLLLLSTTYKIFRYIFFFSQRPAPFVFCNEKYKKIFYKFYFTFFLYKGMYDIIQGSKVEILTKFCCFMMCI